MPDTQVELRNQLDALKQSIALLETVGGQQAVVDSLRQQVAQIEAHIGRLKVAVSAICSLPRPRSRPPARRGRGAAGKVRFRRAGFDKLSQRASP